MRRFARVLAPLSTLPFACVAVAGAACESTPDGPMGGRAPGGHVTPAADGGCVPGSLPLLVAPAPDAPDARPYKLYVPATVDERAVAFLLDTGSPLTFLHQPLTPEGGTLAADGFVPDAGSAVVGCDRLTLGGAPVVADPPVDGLRVAGTLGDEQLLARSLRIDFVARQVEWSDPGVAFAGTTTWPSARFDRPGGYVRIHDVAFDGNPVQMFVDTGAADSVWLGQQGQPGDVEIDGEDSQGDKFKMYLGTAALTIGSYSAKVPVFRVPSFPYLQEAVDALHGQLNGLFGLSSFPRGIVFDTDANVVRVAP